MATKKKKRQGRKNAAGAALTIIAVILLAVILIANNGDLSAAFGDIAGSTVENAGGGSRDVAELADLEHNGGKLLYYVIDTGNSDSMLVLTPDKHALLVDAAEYDDFATIENALHALGVEQLDAVVATHPDADHIGSMAAVIEEFTPQKIYMPAYSKNTTTFQKMLKAVDAGNMEAVIVTAPMEFSLGEARFTAISPQDKEYEDANDSSVVLAVRYGNNKLLLMGDAEKPAIADMLELYPQYLKADVLKVGHHGSRTSTTQKWLDAVRPRLGVVTCGADNDYGHPHKETLELLDKNGVTVLRSDRNGDIAIFLDGETIEYKTAA